MQFPTIFGRLVTESISKTVQIDFRTSMVPFRGCPGRSTPLSLQLSAGTARLGRPIKEVSSPTQSALRLIVLFSVSHFSEPGCIWSTWRISGFECSGFPNQPLWNGERLGLLGSDQPSQPTASSPWFTRHLLSDDAHRPDSPANHRLPPHLIID
jgi:hypothetical protein